MATLFPRPSGWAIQFLDGRRKRRTITLSPMPRRAAELVLRHVEGMVGSRLANAPLDPEAARWLGGVADPLRDKLARVGLIPGIDGGSPTVARICAASIKARESDCTPRVVYRLRKTAEALSSHLGNAEVGSVTEADAMSFRAALLARGLAEASVRKQCSDARSFFAHAIAHRLIADNPFRGVPCTTTAQVNPAYVTRETAARVIDALPDARWRLLFALGRYAGLRVPSEAQGMLWADVRWDAARLIVRSPKGKRHGKAIREMPLLPEVASAMREWFEVAEPGGHVFPGLAGATGGRVRNVVLGAITRAGVEPWPNLWRTLRASAQTDLEARFPLHVVCAWMGNTTAIAARHYLRVTDEHFAAASALHGALQPNPEPRCT